MLPLAATDHHGSVLCRLWDHDTLSGGEVQQQAGVDALQRQTGVVAHGVHRHCVVGLPPGGEQDGGDCIFSTITWLVGFMLILPRNSDSGYWRKQHLLCLSFACFIFNINLLRDVR